jgi:DNA-binding transcriptional ArsR family regulator
VQNERQLLFERHAAICNVLSHGLRLELIDLLREGERTVGDLASRVDTSQSNVSRHLAVMRDRGALRTRRDGAHVYYRLADPRILEAFDLMRAVLLDQLRREGELVDGVTSSG